MDSKYDKLRYALNEKSDSEDSNFDYKINQIWLYKKNSASMEKCLCIPMDHFIGGGDTVGRRMIPKMSHVEKLFGAE